MNKENTVKNHQIEAIAVTIPKITIYLAGMVDCLISDIEKGKITIEQAVEQLSAHTQEKELDILNDWVADNMGNSKDEGVRYMLCRIWAAITIFYDLLKVMKDIEPQIAKGFEKSMELTKRIVSKLDYLGFSMDKLTQDEQHQQQIERRHFFPGYGKDFYTSIFNQLKEKGYFDNTAALESWLYICGVGDEKIVENGDFTPLNWAGFHGALLYLIKKIFRTQGDYIWLTAGMCFMKQGKPINTNSLKQGTPSHKDTAALNRIILKAAAGE